MEENPYKEEDNNKTESSGSNRRMNFGDVEDPLLAPFKREKAKTLSESTLLQKEKKRESQRREESQRKADKQFIMECITYFFEPHGEKEQEQKEMKQQLAILLKRKTRRTDFAYILNQQRTKQMCMPYEKFQLFCDVMEIAFKEIEKSEDFRGNSAKILMHMTATYYTVLDNKHEFVQSRLKHLTIWRNFQFWTQTLWDAISTEREQVLGSHNFKDMTPEQQEDFVECEKNIAFATIGSFTHSMLSVNVPLADVKMFIEKWCSFYSLSADQQATLTSNADSLMSYISQTERDKKLEKEIWLLQRQAAWSKEQQDSVLRRRLKEREEEEHVQEVQELTDLDNSALKDKNYKYTFNEYEQLDEAWEVVNIEAPATPTTTTTKEKRSPSQPPIPIFDYKFLTSLFQFKENNDDDEEGDEDDDNNDNDNNESIVGALNSFLREKLSLGPSNNDVLDVLDSPAASNNNKAKYRKTMSPQQNQRKWSLSSKSSKSTTPSPKLSHAASQSGSSSPSVKSRNGKSPSPSKEDLVRDRAYTLPSRKGKPMFFDEDYEYANDYDDDEPSTVTTQWQDDSKVTHCPICMKSFTSLRRKHHCRKCGRIFCDPCSSKRAIIPEHSPKARSRVCLICFNIISKLNNNVN